MTFEEWWTLLYARSPRIIPIYVDKADARKIWDASRAEAKKEAAEIARSSDLMILATGVGANGTDGNGGENDVYA